MERLEDLFSALHNAVLETQKLTEQQHIRQFRRYFEAEKSGSAPKPKMLSFEIPEPHPKSAKKEDQYRTVDIPLIVLSPPTSLRIKDLHIQFSVQLSGLSERRKGKGPISGKDEMHAGDVEMDFGQEGANVATVEVTFEQAAVPESVHRLTDLLSKTIPST